MKRLGFWVVVVIAVVVAIVAGARRGRRPPENQPVVVRAKGVPEADRIRRTLFAEVQPVALANCDLKRFGEANDGGYLLCANLLKDVQSAYSYGISGYDGWGCQVSHELKVKVHEYDCFNLNRPVCEGGALVFHEECVAGKRSTDESGRLFDTPESQFRKNGDANHRVLVKMDVEGAEWETLLKAPDAVLDSIDQLAIEFHGSGRPRFLDAMKRLKQFFYVAHLHFNNYSCANDVAPFPAWAYEVLLVNKRIGVPDPTGTPPQAGRANAPNNPNTPDCQSQ